MVDAQSLIDQLRKIDRSEYDQEAKEQFDRWVTDIEEIEAIRTIGKSFVIQNLINEYQEDIKKMNKTLLEQRQLNELERWNIMDRKTMYTKFIHCFDADRRLETLAATIDDLLV